MSPDAVAETETAPVLDLIQPTVCGEFVFASPHSGRDLPDDFGHVSGLAEIHLRSAEDGWVDQIVDPGPALGIPLLSGRISRSYVDLNRAADELDPDLIVDCPLSSSNARITAGFGVVARVTGDGLPLYDRKLTMAEVQARLDRVHAPYHAVLSRLMHQARDHNGRATLVDWHSMPARAAGERVSTRGHRIAGVDVVLGDRHATSCRTGLTRKLKTLFEAQGLRVAVNRPYAGGYSTVRWGRPDDGFHAIQIELNRGLYMDETRLEPSAEFDRCKAILDRVISGLLASKA